MQPNGLGVGTQFVEQCIDAPLLADYTAREQCDAIHAALNFSEEVTRQHRHHTAIEQFAHGFIEDADALGIESVRGFIENDHPRLAKDGLREIEPLSTLRSAPATSPESTRFNRARNASAASARISG
jgi:hypothetical protein